MERLNSVNKSGRGIGQDNSNESSVDAVGKGKAMGKGSFKGKGQGKGCFNCGDPRQFARECPYPKGKGKGKGSISQGNMTCFSCGGQGHMARNCPYPKVHGKGGTGTGTGMDSVEDDSMP